MIKFLTSGLGILRIMPDELLVARLLPYHQVE